MQKINAGDYVAEANVQFAQNQPEVAFGGNQMADHLRASVNSSTPVAQPTTEGDEGDDMADVNLTERSESGGPQVMTAINTNPQEMKNMTHYAQNKQ